MIRYDAYRTITSSHVIAYDSIGWIPVQCQGQKPRWTPEITDNRFWLGTTEGAREEYRRQAKNISIRQSVYRFRLRMKYQARVVYRRRSTNGPYHFQRNFGKKFPTNVSWLKNVSEKSNGLELYRMQNTITLLGKTAIFHLPPQDEAWHWLTRQMVRKISVVSVKTWKR